MFKNLPKGLITLVFAISSYFLVNQQVKLIPLNQLTSLTVAPIFVFLIISLAFQLAHQVEYVADKLKEPYGTMILTISAVIIEVVIFVMMMSHASSTTLARDAIYSAVMLDINGILGLCAIVGGIKYGEQEYNVNSGNTYVVMIMTAIGLSMVLPVNRLPEIQDIGKALSIKPKILERKTILSRVCDKIQNFIDTFIEGNGGSV